jgi:hypothetical protein
MYTLTSAKRADLLQRLQHLQELYQDARSTEHKIIQHSLTQLPYQIILSIRHSVTFFGFLEPSSG